MPEDTAVKFCGHPVNAETIEEIREIISTCNGISRTELANTVCELFDWKRPTGKLKSIECRQFLEGLHEKEILSLPEQKHRSRRNIATSVKRTVKAKKGKEILGPLKQLLPLSLIRVKDKAQRDLWYEYVDRYHYLGYRLPFGAQLRYFVEAEDATLLGCLQFSSPGWMMAPRDQWIGWDPEQRKRNLQKIVNNSRFLILPWVKVKNLASSVLALARRGIADDWEEQYGIRPVLLETLVDMRRFTGTCYKASNWVCVGVTTGRGRMDRNHSSENRVPKDIYLYPLTPRFREALKV